MLHGYHGALTAVDALGGLAEIDNGDSGRYGYRSRILRPYGKENVMWFQSGGS